MLKGIRKKAGSNNTSVDVFNHLEIQYKTSQRGDLVTVSEVNCLASHLSIARNTNNFQRAVWLTQFVLTNTRANEPVPKLFRALKNAYTRLSSPDEFPKSPLLLSICFVTLMESGLLPEYTTDHRAHISGLTEAILYDKTFPEYPGAVWEGLTVWMDNFIRDHTELKMPNSIAEITGI